MQTAFIAYLIINFGHINGVSRRGINRAIEKYASKDDGFTLMLWDDTSEFKNANDICIKWWHNDNDDIYYIFVSESLLKKGLYWIFPDEDVVWINGKNIKNGSLCDLMDGTYDVVTEVSGKTENYKMKIRYSSDIATLFLNTQSGEMDSIDGTKEYYESGNYTLFEKGGRFCYAGVIEKIHCRGNVTWFESDKKSYKIKLQKAANLLGMGKASKWNLVSNTFDNTLMRNMIAFEIAKDMGLVYTPDAVFTDVYANGEFIGNYILTEQIEIEKNRINIRDLQKQTEKINLKMFGNYELFSEQSGRLKNIKGFKVKNEPGDISGGYLLEIDLESRYDEEECGFLTSRNQPVVIKSPSDASYLETVYIASRYQDFEDALFADDGISSFTGASYLDYIDINSFARKYLVEELTKNYDAAYTSQYLYKPDDSVSEKFFAGPVWDYDNSMARSEESTYPYEGKNPCGLYASKPYRASNIWYALYNKDEFRKTFAEIFFSKLKPKVNDIVENEIDYYIDNMIESVVNNAIRWGTYDEADENEIIFLYNNDVETVKNFLSERMGFLTEEWIQYRK